MDRKTQDGTQDETPDGTPAGTRDGTREKKKKKVICIKQEPHKIKVQIQDEGHTLGNLFRIYLLDHPQVHYAAYNQPHPYEEKILLEWRTKKSSHPCQVASETGERIVQELQTLESQLQFWVQWNMEVSKVLGEKKRHLVDLIRNFVIE
jgi:DNA-directed RNA polymerase subunit L